MKFVMNKWLWTHSSCTKTCRRERVYRVNFHFNIQLIVLIRPGIDKKDALAWSVTGQNHGTIIILIRVALIIIMSLMACQRIYFKNKGTKGKQ